MSRTTHVGLAAGACLTLTALALPSVAASTASAVGHPTPARWAPTHTLALPVQGRSLGAAPASRRLRISVALPLRHADRIGADVVARSNPDSASYGHFLTPAQVRARYGPSAASVRHVASYLRSQGLTHVAATPNRLLVDATGTVAQVSRAFDTRIARYVVRGHRVYANTRPAMVPASLRGQVAAVLGLSDLAMTTPHVVHAPVTGAAGSPNLTGFYAKTLQKVYQDAKLPAANRTEIAVLSIGEQQRVIANLRHAEAKEGFPRVPVKVVYTAPKEAIVHDNPLSANLEFDLDTQISTFMAQSVKRLDIYAIATYTDSDVARGINSFVSQNRAEAGSASLGECDSLAYLDGAMVTTDEALAEGGLQGQSFFASTGDNGSFCPVGASTGEPGGGPGQSWPAIGEYTAAVGGTTLVADSDGHVTSEIAWSGGGGGISSWGTAAPWTYQTNAAAQSAEYANYGGRAVPDIAAVADGNTGVLIYGDPKADNPEPVGGTSVSAPLVMGIWARIDGVHHNRLGLASYRFYRVYDRVNPATEVDDGVIPVYVPNAAPKPVASFRDVTVGGNGAYVAKPGWDYVTGVGTPLASFLTKALGH